MSNAQAQIGFEQLGIGAVLKRYRLIVPPNQRDYAWTAKEVGTLLEDLSLAINEDEAQHFLGTIVTIPRGHGVLEVVDGQQRLATTALTLGAMRHIANGSATNLSRALEDYVISVDSSNLEMSPKMRLNTADTQVFHELLENGNAQHALVPNRESHELLVDAYRLAKSHLQNVARPVRDIEKIRVFLRWMNYIEYNSKVILLIVPDNVNAYKMFETLNDRGLKVSQSDLVKNYVFGQCGDRLDEAQRFWSYIKNTLELLDEDDIIVNFLRQALIAKVGYLRESAVYEMVQKTARGVQTSLSLLRDLEAIATDYVALAYRDHEKWNGYPEGTRRALRVLRLFDIKPLRPLLLAIAGRFAPKEATKAFECLVSCGVRLIIAASTRSGSVEQPLARAASQVYNGEIETTNELRRTIRHIVPNDEQFKSAFETASVSQSKFARYYLRSIEMAAKGEPDPYYIPNDDPDAINTEHVLPLKPQENWPEFDADTHRAYVKRLGNQALMRAKTNSDLKSASFKDKQAAFADSPYETTSMIASAPEWTSEQIVARQKRLAVLAVSVWPAV